MNARHPDWVSAFLRPGSTHSADITRDFFWLLGIGLVLLATGIGLRDPWPADEPRFALIARDMAAMGDWLLPRVGGDIYADKPPLYFWLLALVIKLTGSLRMAFLLPSLFAALACTFLIYDLARRLWNRETGLIAGIALLLTVQFVWQARQAQIDAMLCFWTTLSLYGLLRHLLLGPQWRWYCVGWTAAGFGVITKGVGFLPLLVLVPYVMLRSHSWSPRFTPTATGKWLLGPLAFVAATAVWLAPMLLAANDNPAVAAYRDEILFRQTITRYTDAWHHREPFWYFLLEVIPWLWLPLTALLPWIAPQWRRALQQRDLRIALLLGWIALVIAFFSASTGKRGVYVLPAVPAIALACAPYLQTAASRIAAQRVMFYVTAVIASLALLAVPYLLIRGDKRVEVLTLYEFDPLGPLIVIALSMVAVCLIAKPRRGFIAFAGALCSTLLIISFWVNPAMDAARSGRSFVARVLKVANVNAPLGFVAFKEQYLLQMQRPVVHFGHARWREGEQETMDAARWLAGSPRNQLIVNQRSLDWCFKRAERHSLGDANRAQWYLVRGTADQRCIELGMPDVAHFYNPPNLTIGDGVLVPSRQQMTERSE
jgi:4-amino-4-deoxy-L-arabinose transferase-like glycosyltransferase